MYIYTHTFFSYSNEADTEKKGGKTKLILFCNYPFTRFYFTLQNTAKTRIFHFLPYVSISYVRLKRETIDI